MELEIWETTKIFIDGNKLKIVNDKVSPPQIKEVTLHDNGAIRTFKDGLFFQSYDDRNNLIRHEDSGGWVSNEYNENNKVIHIKNNKGFEAFYRYDEDGNIIDIIKPK